MQEEDTNADFTMLHTIWGYDSNGKHNVVLLVNPIKNLGYAKRINNI